MVVPPAQVKNYSFHSFRIYLACALKKAGVSEAGIMEFCRWRARSSLPIYARTDAQEYMETVLLALRQQFDNFQTTTAPDVGPPAHVEEGLEADGNENDDLDDDFG